MIQENKGAINAGAIANADAVIALNSCETLHCPEKGIAGSAA